MLKFMRLAFFSLVLLGLFSSQAYCFPRTQIELQRIFNSLVKTGVTYGNIPSLMRPPMLKVIEAANFLEKNDQVFLVAFPDKIRIYPQKLMVWHEVVNEAVDNKSYCITYSPISGSLAAYESRINNMSLIFDAEGRVYNSNSVLIDRNTGSLWLQIAGIAFDGPLSGKGLKHIPVMWTSWQKAREAFPNALVMATPRNSKRAYGRDPYGSYEQGNSYYQDEEIIYPLSTGLNSLFKPKTQVIGLEYNDLFLAIDIAYVKKVGCSNFFLGPYPLMAVYDQKLDVVRIFNRTVWDKPALFMLKNGQVMDIETESVWNTDGLATEGNLKDATMEQIFGIYSFWFAWAAINPETEAVPGPSVVPDSALIKGKI